MAEPEVARVVTTAVVREGDGPEVLLVHGGASPATTWRGLEDLRERWTLVYFERRGHDFELDAADLMQLLDARPHLVAHSYGALGASLVAARAPERLRSLTLLEPPFGHLVEGDAEVEYFEALGDEFLTRGLEADPARLREFMRIAGADVEDGPLSPRQEAWVERARGGRLPREARPDFAAVRAAGVPALVASGGHAAAIERICDVVAGALGAERAVVPGGGHFVARAEGFAARLDAFLRSAQA